MTTDFGAELRRLRQERRLSIRQLAAEIPLGKSHVHDLETGRRGPTPAIAQRLDETLDARGRLVALRRSPGSTDDDEPNLSGLVNVALVGVVEPRPLNHADAVRVRATTAHLVALDTLHGSDGLLPFAVRAFHAVADQVAVVDGSAEVRSAVADLGAAAAWIAADAVKRDESRALGLEALALADLAGDVRLHRFLLSHLSMVSEHGGRYADALAYAERLLAEDHDDPRVHAMVEVRRGRAGPRSGALARDPARGSCRCGRLGRDPRDRSGPRALPRPAELRQGARGARSIVASTLDDPCPPRGPRRRARSHGGVPLMECPLSLTAVNSRCPQYLRTRADLSADTQSLHTK